MKRPVMILCIALLATGLILGIGIPSPKNISDESISNKVLPKTINKSSRDQLETQKPSASSSPEAAAQESELPWVLRKASYSLPKNIERLESFSFRPFDDVAYVAKMDTKSTVNRTVSRLGIKSLIGELLDSEGRAIGDFRISISKKAENTVSASFTTHEGKHFRIANENSELVVEELEASNLPDCGNAEHIDPEHSTTHSNRDSGHDEKSDLRVQADGADSSSSEQTSSRLSTSANSTLSGNTRIDLLVVYTPDVKARMGGSAAVEVAIANAVVDSNSIYSNSEISLDVFLVEAVEVNYTESGSMNTDLTRLRGTRDGFMDEVHTLRESYGADMVALVTNDGTYCGLGYVLTNPEAAYSQNYPFSITHYQCLSSSTLVHELGHNMGSSHDRDNARDESGALTQGTYPYGYGHRFGSYRSIMAYAPGTRAPHFSNPNVLYRGFATGVNNSEDNARSIEQTKVFIAEYRTNSFSVSGNISFSGNGLSDVTLNSAELGSQQSNSVGNFIYSESLGESNFTITPSKTGYVFEPESESGALSGEAIISINFTASCADGYIIEDEECSATAIDTDGDGLSDNDEERLGTNPELADTDSDGVSDGQEVLDGSDPLDKGSALPPVGTEVCSEWNGFLDLLNVQENVNLGDSPITVVSSLFDIDGNGQSSVGFDITAGAQTDLLVHGMQGFTENSYGRVCSTHSGESGEFDGRMIYYKPNSSGSGYDFAFAMPFLSGKTGSQFVPFNTFQPSLAPGASSNVVANWLQLTNISSSSQSGEMRFYNIDGSELGIERVTIAGQARQDFSGHQFGANKVGFVEWAPDNDSTQFQLRNVRYVYDNAQAFPTFTTAFQLEASFAKNGELSVPVTTGNASSVLEVSNVGTTSEIYSAKIYDQNGNFVHEFSATLAPKATAHWILDPVLNSQNGAAFISGNNMIAVGMQYGRLSDGSISYMYGVEATSALGSTLSGSYNTFLNQGCDLIATNPSDEAVNIRVDLLRYDGTEVASNLQYQVPSRGSLTTDICSFDSVNNYGVVTIKPESVNSIYATVVRKGASNSYRFPTPLR